MTQKIATAGVAYTQQHLVQLQRQYRIHVAQPFTTSVGELHNKRLWQCHTDLRIMYSRPDLWCHLPRKSCTSQTNAVHKQLQCYVCRFWCYWWAKPACYGAHHSCWNLYWSNLPGLYFIWAGMCVTSSSVLARQPTVPHALY